MSSRRTFAALAAFLALTATAGSGTALAQPGRSLPSTATAQAAPSLGMSIMSALIDADGTALHAGGLAKSSYDSATFSYTLVFNRPLTGCAISITPWVSGHTAVARSDLTGGNAAVVDLRSPDNAPVAGPFHMIAVCSE